MNIKLNILFLLISNCIYSQSETDTIIIPNLTLPGIYTEEIDTVKHTVDTNKVYEFALVHQKPEFIGGQTEMLKFIANNSNLDNYEFNGCTKVFVQFFIERNGNVSKPRIIRGCNKILDREAINIVKKFPKWKPGKLYDTTVKVKYILPINFEFSQ